MRTIETVRAGLNQYLVMQGIVLTMYDNRNKLSEQVAKDVVLILAILFIILLFLGMLGFLKPLPSVNLF